jgi:xanthine dehydrogenase YagS FAD-binding subunit
VAERTLLCVVPTRDAFARAADAELEPAVPQAHNSFKIALAKRTIVAALSELAGTDGGAE